MTDDDKPRALSDIESAWMHSVRGVTEKFRGVFPYGSTSAETLAQYAFYLVVALPILLVTLAVAGLTVGFDAFIESITASGLLIAGWIRLALTNVEVAGAVVALLYLSSIFKYRPRDVNDYLTTRTPTSYEAWEMLITTVAFAAIPSGYFALLYFEEASVLLATTGLSPFALALVGFVLVQVPLQMWMRHRYKRESYSAQMATLWGFTVFFAVPATLYLAQVGLGFDLLLVGSGVEAVFIAHLAWMAFVARRLRWTVYEDWMGFNVATKLSGWGFVVPMIPLWGLVSRGPLVFAAYFLLFGEGLTMAVAVASLSPLVASLGYVSWRLLVTGDLKKPPRGWLSSPGRKQYEENRQKNKAKMNDIAHLANTVEEFNEFAADHGLSTLDVPSLMSVDKDAIRSELQNNLKNEGETIHSHASSLTGDDYTEYMERRQAVLDEL